MANDYTSNPMVIDTVTTVPVDPTKLYLIKAVEWITPTTVDHVADFRDASGNQLIYFTCVTAKQNMIKYFEPAEGVYGLYIPTLGSGKLLIHRV